MEGGFKCADTEEDRRAELDKKMCRKITNTDYVIPFSVAIVMKKVKYFDPILCQLEVAMTMIQRYKLTGIPNEIRARV